MPIPPDTLWKQLLRHLWLPIVLVAGLAARFWVATYGSNYDLESWKIALSLVEHGQNVYMGTFRYNYGPVWFQLLHLLDVVALHNAEIFRGLLIAFLSAVDAGISWVLWRKYGRLAATLYFLNPVSIMITGYHNQFDNLAVLLGLWSVLLFGNDFDQSLNRRKFLGLGLLGLSLMTKHILFAFPLWLAVKQKGLAQKALVLLVPVAIFLLGFAPYWSDGKTGIIEHVFQYKSFPTAYFYKFVMPTIIEYPLNATIVWFLVLALFAFICRRLAAVDSLLFYTCVMLATTPATTNEYLVIPLAFTCARLNIFTVAYMIIAACHIAAGGDGPPLQNPHAGGIVDLAIYALGLAMVWAVWRDNLLDLLKSCRDEISRQLGHEPPH